MFVTHACCMRHLPGCLPTQSPKFSIVRTSKEEDDWQESQKKSMVEDAMEIERRWPKANQDNGECKWTQESANKDNTEDNGQQRRLPQ